MHIVHAAAEMAPIAKIGGLGDVILGLSRAFIKMGHRVDIIIPKYNCLDLSLCQNLKLIKNDLKSFENDKWYTNSVWTGVVEGCTVFFLEPHHPDKYFHEGKIYAGATDIPRFIYFSRLLLEFLYHNKEPIDILNLHDWHVSLAAPLYKDIYKPQGLQIGALTLNIHNLEYQGKCATPDLDKIGLQGEKYHTLDKLKDENPSDPETINLLKGGIVYADKIIAVSPNYSREILTVEMAFNLENTLRQHEHKITGILNGIDLEIWSPKKDPFVPAPYSNRNTIQEILQAKSKNKKTLQKRMGLAEEEKPFIICISRLVSQKGPYLIKEGLLHAVKKGAQSGLLGFSPLPKMQQEFENLSEKMKNDPNIFFQFKYDESLSRLMYAAADFLIVPSFFEPCGLTQLIGLRYGAIPIVRRTGGLADTVFDNDDPLIPLEKRNGYTFDTFDFMGINDAINRALECWKNDQDEYQKMLLRGMNMDFGWEKSAKDYLNIYKQLIKF